MSPVITFDLAGDSESPILLYKGWPAKSEKVGWVLLGQYWVGMAIRAPDEAKNWLLVIQYIFDREIGPQNKWLLQCTLI